LWSDLFIYPHPKYKRVMRAGLNICKRKGDEETQPHSSPLILVTGIVNQIIKREKEVMTDAEWNGEREQ
jgi:hypothetical protein